MQKTACKAMYKGSFSRNYLIISEMPWRTRKYQIPKDLLMYFEIYTFSDGVYLGN